MYVTGLIHCSVLVPKLHSRLNVFGGILLESAVGITGLHVLTKQAEELPISKK